jgi:hypothetical protein
MTMPGGVKPAGLYKLHVVEPSHFSKVPTKLRKGFVNHETMERFAISLTQKSQRPILSIGNVTVR